MSGRSSAGSSAESDRSPSYCSNCGEKLAASTNFCPNCGADCSRMHRPPETERSVTETESSATDRDVLEYRITKALEAGWELEHDFGDHAVMVRRNFGSAGTHALVLVFTFWWTMGGGNALYALYSYFGASDRMVLRANHVDTSGVHSSVGSDPATRSRSRAESEPTDESGRKWIGIALLCWLGMLLTLLIASSASPVWTGVFAGASIALGLIGIGFVPPVRRRLESRRSITTNGWTRTVEERSVTGTDEPCTNCARPVERGIERTYKREFTVLGVPLATGNRGVNHYCRRCANAEFADRDPRTSRNRRPDRTLELHAPSASDFDPDPNADEPTALDEGGEGGEGDDRPDTDVESDVDRE